MAPASNSDEQPAPAATRGTVVTVTPEGVPPGSTHDRITLEGFARALARLKRCDVAGEYQPGRPYAGPLYFVPSDTLTGVQAARLGIRGPGDLFGGVVPQAFVATKAISHPLIGDEAAHPPGWNPAFARRLGDAVLDGHSAFSREDAHHAGLRLLRKGPVRIKPVRAKGGTGQSVARDGAALQETLDRLDADEIAEHGLVLEEHLEEVRTFSVGQVQVDDLVASYWGVQRLTRSNSGAEVFGGSDLTVVRGGFDALQGLRPAPELDRAIGQARRYDEAVHACYAGFFASRRNYDVALGRDAQGGWRSGVLEQSWRVGGATGPELAALALLRDEPQRQRVRAIGVEVFGDSPEPPAGAIVHFRGPDPDVGPLTKYTVVESDVHPS
ncbi:DUF3182 family protein [Ramlibacter sp. Leaf400]|uniref:DUF3182 family protein n=1 Tax=Ramlibacter sp. Leaf400 TaxID=1736365 RepID=UPI0006F3BCE0|nr:DUF3182 family protein [Ramlibacter sp. Leaf400]KQT08116.1 hypothetical protein ASG30_16955 [Ramlibacter sp. Leaf400]